MGRKALTVLGGEIFEPAPDLVDTTFARIIDRTAAERRETGAEYDASVEEVRLGHDTFVKTGDRLIDHRQD